MMDFKIEWVDVRPYLHSGQQPVFMLPRETHGTTKQTYGFNAAEVAKLGEHWVPQGSVDGEVPWGVTRAGDMVRIPLWGYKTTSRSFAEIWGMGLRIGMAALSQLRQYTNDVPKAAVLVLGHDVTDLAPLEDAFRCYVGVAVQTK